MRYSAFRTKNKHNLVFPRAMDTDKCARAFDLNVTTHRYFYPSSKKPCLITLMVRTRSR